MKSASKDVPPLDGTPRSAKFHAGECLKYGILRTDLKVMYNKETLGGKSDGCSRGVIARGE